MDSEVAIRLACLDDASVLAEFNCAMALETENIRLTPDVVLKGVSHLLTHNELGFYVVAEMGGQIAGSLMVTPEWSDWRNGVFWWIQSVYVRPGCRRQGVFRRLFDFVRDLAKSEKTVCGLRLYVEHGNEAAQETYDAMGMRETSYQIYEEVFVPFT